YHQIAPEQSAELLRQFRRMAIEQSGRLSPSHDMTKGGTARLAPYGVEGPRHFGRVHGLGDRQSEHRNDRRIAYLADELRPERGQNARERLAIVRRGQISGYLKSPGALADACA